MQPRTDNWVFDDHTTSNWVSSNVGMPSPGTPATQPSARDESAIWDDPNEATRKLSSQDIARTLGSATDLEMDWDEDDSETHMYASQHAQVIMPARAKPAAKGKRAPARPQSSVRQRTTVRADVSAEVLDASLAFPELKEADPATQDALADLPPVPPLKARRAAPRRAIAQAREPRVPRQTMERPIAQPRTSASAPALRYPTYQSQSATSAALHPSTATRPAPPTSGARIPTLQWAPTAITPTYVPPPQPQQVEEDENDAWAAAWEHAERAMAADEPQAYAQPQQAYAQPQQAYVQPQAYHQAPQSYAQPQAHPQTLHGYSQEPELFEEGYEEPVYEEPIYEEPIYEEPIYEEPEAYAQPYTQQPYTQQAAFAPPAPQVRQVTHRRADGPTITNFPPTPVRYDQYGRQAYDGPTLGGPSSARLPVPAPVQVPVSYSVDEQPFARRSSILGALFWSVIPGSALFGAVLWGRVLLAGPDSATPPMAAPEPTPIIAPAAAAPSITPTITPEPLPSQPSAAAASKSKRSRSSHDDADTSTTSSSSSTHSSSSRSSRSHDDADTSITSSRSSSTHSAPSRSSNDDLSAIAAAPPKATRTREDFDSEPSAPAKESKGGIGILRLNSRPWSQVTVDGKPIGNTPQMGLRLSAGSHQISLVNPQMGMSKKFKVEVQADQIVTRIETLED